MDETGQKNWKRMAFKGGKVWVRLDEKGLPVEKGGKFSIKYKLDQDVEYSAGKKDVMDLVDGNVPAGSKPAPKTKAAKAKKAAPLPDHLQDCIVIHTDGACSGNPGPAGIGVVLQYKGNEKQISRHIGEGTNNIAELTAILDGLAAVKNRSLPVRLFTDSSYAMGLLTNNWKAKKNVALVAKIKNLMAKFKDLKIYKVKGHADDPLNNLADQLAVKAIQSKED
ncbi:MAG: ribonuclease H [Desulfatibacillaceae bacterium]|nr:ribonuclease H [Desulfatibacillaceae bacterium]